MAAMKFALLCIFSSLCLTVSARQCFQGWQYFENRCYWPSDIKLTWIEAQNYCGFFGASLAEIENANENLFVKSIVKPTDVFLIGGTDMFDEGFWVWVSTAKQIYKYTDWSAQEPNGGIMENCLAYVGTIDPRWEDVQCHTPYRFLCETEAGLRMYLTSLSECVHDVPDKLGEIS